MRGTRLNPLFRESQGVSAHHVKCILFSVCCCKKYVLLGFFRKMFHSDLFQFYFRVRRSIEQKKNTTYNWFAMFILRWALITNAV